MSSDEMRERSASLKARRKNDRINLILNAAAHGNLESLKMALEVNREPMHHKHLMTNLKYSFTLTLCCVRSQNGNLNVCDSLMRTPLHVAASEGQARIELQVHESYGF